MGVFHPLSITYTNTIIIFLSFLFFIHAMQLAGSWFSNQGLNLAPGNGRQILNHWTTREVPTIVIGFMSCNFKILLKAV